MTDVKKMGEDLSKELFGEEESTPEVEVPEAPNKLKIGEKEYTQEELADLVKLGEMGREVETRYNTKLDRVYPEFTKKSQRLAELEQKYEQIEADKRKSQELTPQDEEQAIREAKEAAKKLGIVTIEDFEDLLGKSYKKFYDQERAAERLLDTATKFETEINGEDGRPAFKKLDILQYMADNNVNDMEVAYELLNKEKLAEWRTGQMEGMKKPGISTTRQTPAIKKPADVKVTSDNLNELVSQALDGKF
jgi:hypothetical protein